MVLETENVDLASVFAMRFELSCGHYEAISGLVGASVRLSWAIGAKMKPSWAILEALVANLVASLRLKRRKSAKIVGITRRCRLYRNLRGFVQSQGASQSFAGPSWRSRGPYWGLLGAILGPNWRSWRLSWGSWNSCWTKLALETEKVDVISVLVRLSVAMSKPSWATLRPPWGCFGPSWGRDKAIFGHFGGFGCELGR